MPGKRIQPSEKISKGIMDIIQNLNNNGNNQKVLGQLGELGVHKVVQELLEKEVEQHIGTAYYEQEDERSGYRNGYKPAHLKTAEKKILVEKPQISDSPEPFKSSIWPHIKERY